jgi:hypothetical protein
VIWAAALLADAVVRVVMSFTLPVDVVPGLGGALWPVTFLVIQVVTNIYYNRAGLYRILGARWVKRGLRLREEPACRCPSARPACVVLAKMAFDCEEGACMKYLLIHYIDEAILGWVEGGHDIDDPENQRALEAWDAEMVARGILVSGAPLRPVSETKTLQVRGGELLITDGPYIETKEQIAGYCVLECESLDLAIEVSARHPTSRIGTFELRPFA